ncbi:SDR family oxidoreductase [Janibacter sp. GS2]|uniref:SDR family oxidoreductase n=1 Tax=Janibacter sp. GS2 TaxID=3442646 RepID=UPI003EBDEB35
MKILITGGSGFLGTSVGAGLVSAGHSVISADLRPAVTPGVTSTPLDVTDAVGVRSLLLEHRPEAVVHLAAIVTPGKGSQREVERRVDVDGTRNVVAGCVAAGVRRLVVSSSGAAYGYHPDNPDWITEDHPVRGSVEFAYSDHKAQVEHLLAAARREHPQLEQVVLRIGTILGERVDNQITALFLRKRLLGIRGARSPFVFIWDADVAAIVQRAVVGDVIGTFNVAGDGALPITQIAERLGKQVLWLPGGVLRAALAVGSTVGVSRYGPEQTRFLKYRPVLDNTRLREVFGYTPTHTSAEAFEAWLASHPEALGRRTREG